MGNQMDKVINGLYVGGFLGKLMFDCALEQHLAF